jgi:hypothetical protein
MAPPGEVRVALGAESPPAAFGHYPVPPPAFPYGNTVPSSSQPPPAY